MTVSDDVKATKSSSEEKIATNHFQGYLKPLATKYCMQTVVDWRLKRIENSTLCDFKPFFDIPKM